jgi:hydrogenase maturation factor
MNLLYGQLVDVLPDKNELLGRVRVHGALMKVPLGLVLDARPGDTLLVCDGIALGKVDPTNKEVAHVPGHTR